MNKEEKYLLKSFIEWRYPKESSNWNLNLIFDYYVGICTKALKDIKKIGFSINRLEEDDEKRILDFIEENYDDDSGKEMLNYYYLLKLVINILSKYYDSGEKK